MPFICLELPHLRVKQNDLKPYSMTFYTVEAILWTVGS